MCADGLYGRLAELLAYGSRLGGESRSPLGVHLAPDHTIVASMVSAHIFPADLLVRYEVREWRNACAVLSVAHPQEWADIVAVLRRFRLLRTDIGEKGVKGGGKSLVALRIDRLFRQQGWRPRQFNTAIHVDDEIGQVRFLLDKRVGGAVTFAFTTGAVRSA